MLSQNKLTSISVSALDKPPKESVLKKNKDINGGNSVASSLNSIVIKQFTNMTKQYNLYASTILEMEEKIKALKNIMLSASFIQNCQHITLDDDTSLQQQHIKPKSDYVKVKKNIVLGKEKENIIINNETATANDTDSEPDHEHETEHEHEHKNKICNNIKYTTGIENFVTPSQNDTLFWCFYIIYNGYSCYEYEKNYFTAEQQFKIQTIERVKKGENKNILKENKISKNSFESGLMTTSISPKMLNALCLFYNINVLFVYKKTYYEICVNSEKSVYVIKYIAETNKYSVYLPTVLNVGEPSTDHLKYIEKIKENYWKRDNIEKPLLAITTYSVSELTNICSKLNISIINETSNKKKTKAELYKNIVEKI